MVSGIAPKTKARLPTETAPEAKTRSTGQASGMRTSRPWRRSWCSHRRGLPLCRSSSLQPLPSPARIVGAQGLRPQGATLEVIRFTTLVVWQTTRLVTVGLLGSLRLQVLLHGGDPWRFCCLGLGSRVQEVRTKPWNPEAQALKTHDQNLKPYNLRPRSPKRET